MNVNIVLIFIQNILCNFLFILSPSVYSTWTNIWITAFVKMCNRSSKVLFNLETDTTVSIHEPSMGQFSVS